MRSPNPRLPQRSGEDGRHADDQGTFGDFPHAAARLGGETGRGRFPQQQHERVDREPGSDKDRETVARRHRVQIVKKPDAKEAQDRRDGSGGAPRSGVTLNAPRQRLEDVEPDPAADVRFQRLQKSLFVTSWRPRPHAWATRHSKTDRFDAVGFEVWERQADVNGWSRRARAKMNA